MATIPTPLSPHSDERYQAMLATLRRADFRLTPQRMVICRFLAESRSHPSPNDIYHAVHEQFPTISRATVYNTVAVLKDLGEIIEIPSAGGNSVRYETDLTPHVNLHCTRCGRILDFPMEQIDEIFTMIDAHTDFKLENIHIEGYGLCPDCQLELAREKEEGKSNG
jgi:Fur family peroxide stress response transcriptional regulator